MKAGICVLCFFIVSFSVSCMRYLTHNRQEVLLEGVDIDQTLLVAADELSEGGWGSVLTIWVIRDQVITPPQARKISELYFTYIDRLTRRFNKWHLTWAIANMYRLGDEKVKEVLQQPYIDATRRAAQISNIADAHANGDKIYMGDAHIGGRKYAQNHVVVPGNKDYLNSYEEYKKKKE